MRPVKCGRVIPECMRESPLRSGRRWGRQEGCGPSQGNTRSQGRATSPPSRLLEGRATTFLHLDPPRAGPVPPLYWEGPFPSGTISRTKLSPLQKTERGLSPRPSPSSTRLTSLWREAEDNPLSVSPTAPSPKAAVNAHRGVREMRGLEGWRTHP